MVEITHSEKQRQIDLSAGLRRTNAVAHGRHVFGQDEICTAICKQPSSLRVLLSEYAGGTYTTGDIGAGVDRVAGCQRNIEARLRIVPPSCALTDPVQKGPASAVIVRGDDVRTRAKVILVNRA